jgi:hypothetical protein
MKRQFLVSFILAVFLCSITTMGHTNGSILIKSDNNLEHVLSASQMLTQNDIWDFMMRNHISTVEDYAKWLQDNIHYQKIDQNKNWDSWQQTLKRGYGDCKNLSILSAKILQMLNYQPILIGYTTSDTGHLFTAFFKDGHMNIFDNTTYQVTSAKTVEEVRIRLAKVEDVATVFKLDLPTKTIEPIYVNPVLNEKNIDISQILISDNNDLKPMSQLIGS